MVDIVGQFQRIYMNRDTAFMDAVSYWKFEADINDAIEATIAEYRISAPQKLTLNGIDCSGAVARWLYTEALNDERIRKYFLQTIEGKVRLRYILISLNLAILARQLLRIWGQHQAVVIPIPGKGHLTKWLLMAAALKQNMSAKEESGNCASGILHGGQSTSRILLFAHHPKFVSLLRSTASASGQAYAFVTANDRERIRLGLSPAETVFLPGFDIGQLNLLRRAIWPQMAYFGNRFEKLLRQEKPGFLLYCEGDAWYQDVVSRLGAKHSINSGCLQWGACPYDTPRTGFRNFSCTVFLSWGDYFSKQLGRFNPDTRFVSVGHPLIESNTHTERSQKITFLLNTDPNGKAYGLDAFHDEFWRFLIWTAKNAIGWRIVVREHPTISLLPSEKKELLQFDNVELHSPKQWTLSESLQDSDIAITVTSSAVIEAASLGAIPFIYNPNPWRYDPDFDRNGAGMEAKSHQEALALMHELISDPEVLSERRRNLYKFREGLFAATGRQAKENIAELMQSQISP